MPPQSVGTVLRGGGEGWWLVSVQSQDLVFVCYRLDRPYWWEKVRGECVNTSWSSCALRKGGHVYLLLTSARWRIPWKALYVTDAIDGKGINNVLWRTEPISTHMQILLFARSPHLCYSFGLGEGGHCRFNPDSCIASRSSPTSLLSSFPTFAYVGCIERTLHVSAWLRQGFRSAEYLDK